MGAFVGVEVQTILPSPFRNVLESIVYNGKTLGIPTGVANYDVVCLFEKGN